MTFFITCRAHLTDGKIQKYIIAVCLSYEFSVLARISKSAKLIYVQAITYKLFDDATHLFVLSLIVGLPRHLRKEKFSCMKSEAILVSTFSLSVLT